METALVRFGVRQHARPEFISKRAPSTTRTSLHFTINNLRAVHIRLSHAVGPFGQFDITVESNGLRTAHSTVRRNCVRPRNLLRSRRNADRAREAGVVLHWSDPGRLPYRQGSLTVGVRIPPVPP